MSFFRDFAKGFANGIIDTAANGIRSSLSQGGGRRIEACCAELGWDIDEREGDIIKLHFKDSEAIGGIRKICIAEGDSPLPHFFCLSHAVLQSEDVPDQVTGYLLTRNYTRRIGGWSVSVNDGNAAFAVEYSALGEALTPAVFKCICQEILTEVSAFDAKMRSAGVL